MGQSKHWVCRQQEWQHGNRRADLREQWLFSAQLVRVEEIAKALVGKDRWQVQLASMLTEAQGIV
jgi:hypothetical protein